MKKLVLLVAFTLLVMSLALGCGQKAEQETEKVPVEVKQAEQADSTRMDSASMDTTEAAAPDSM